MIKVLIVAGSMNVGGIENQLMHLLRQADKDCFQIDFTSTAEHPFYQDEIEALGGRCIHIPPTDGGRHLLRYSCALYLTIKNGEYDIVHSHELFHSGIVLPIAKLAGVKHRFVHAHTWTEGNGPNEKKTAVRRAYNFVMRRLIRANATSFIACSSWAGAYVFGEQVLRQKNYHLVFNSVDTARFLARYGQRESGEYCEDGWVNVIQVGRFSSEKNQLFTAEIAREFKRRGKRIRVLCAGNMGGDYETAVKKKIEEYGLEQYMLLLGVRKDIDVLLRKSAALLLPSYFEGMPLVLIEAQTSGLPCVTSDNYSPEVDFGAGLIRRLSLEEDVAVWADALEAAVQKQQPPKETIERAVREKSFDSRQFAERICALYREDIAQGEVKE